MKELILKRINKYEEYIKLYLIRLLYKYQFIPHKFQLLKLKIKIKTKNTEDWLFNFCHLVEKVVYLKKKKNNNDTVMFKFNKYLL